MEPWRPALQDGGTLARRWSRRHEWHRQTAAAVAMLVVHKTNAHHRRHANSRLVLWYSQVILQLQVVLVPVLVKSIYRVASVVVVVNLIYWCAWRSTLGGEKIIKNLTRCFKSRLFGVLYWKCIHAPVLTFWPFTPRADLIRSTLNLLESVRARNATRGLALFAHVLSIYTMVILTRRRSRAECV